MRRFIVKCYWQTVGKAVVEVADNEDLDDAIAKVEEMEYGLPEDADFVDGSFGVDRDGSHEVSLSHGDLDKDFGPGEQSGP